MSGEDTTPETADGFNPLPGDLWLANDGRLWFVCANEDEDFYIDMVCETGLRATPQHVERYHAPLNLWHRPVARKERIADAR